MNLLHGTTTTHICCISIFSAQAADVTFDYTIAANSTASASDYSSFENGTVTIAAGSNISNNSCYH